MAEGRKNTYTLHKGCNMIEKDSNGELHPVVPPTLTGRHVFIVVIENNETGEVYKENIKAFDREGDAQDYANTYTQHWVNATILLKKIE